MTPESTEPTAATAQPDDETDPLAFLAFNLVNALFDEAEVPVEKRQQINDKCDAFVLRMLREVVR